MSGGSAQCNCDEAWGGPNCNHPVLRSLSALQVAAQEVESFCNLCEETIELARDSFKIFRIPQPLGAGMHLYLTLNAQYNDKYAGNCFDQKFL